MSVETRFVVDSEWAAFRVLRCPPVSVANLGMTNSETPKWKRYEKLVAKVQVSFTPDAQVKLDDRVQGNRSGVERQIDISVRKMVGQFEIFIVIDCKDYSVPVDVKDVEEFIGLLEDVMANKGAIVAASGFTDAARTRASNAGIDLYRLVDAEQHEWQTYISIPVVCALKALGMARFKFGAAKQVLNELVSQDPRYVPLYDDSHNQIGTPLTLMWKNWNEGNISREPGQYTTIPMSRVPLFIRTSQAVFEEIGLWADVQVRQDLYFGQLPLTKITGFYDNAKKHLILPDNAEIITDWVEINEVQRSWQRIPSLDALAVQPVMILESLVGYPVDQLPMISI